MLIKSFGTKNSQVVTADRITVLTGPNNSGKSETLRDLYRLATSAEPYGERDAEDIEPQTVLLDDFQYDTSLNYENVFHGLRRTESATGDDTVVQGVHASFLRGFQTGVDTERLKNVLRRRPLSAKSVWRAGMADLMFLRIGWLDEASRSELLNSTTAANPADPPENLLQAMQLGDAGVRQDLDIAFSAAFDDLHIRLDEHERVNLSLRLASQFPETQEDPFETIQQFRSLRRMDDQGSGFKSFAAILLAVMLSPGRLLLVDSPEAGLYPEQSRSLGAWLGQNAKRFDSQLVLATHDESFVRGLLGASPEVTVVRLSRHKLGTRFQAIGPEDGRKLAHSPLMFGQGGLRSIFQRGVVLTETDEQRVAYEAVAVREFGGNDIAFLHSYGRKTLLYQVKLLGSIGMPMCVVTGLGLLRSRNDFVKILETVLGEAPSSEWLGTRDKLARHIELSLDQASLKKNTKEIEAFLDQFGQADDEDDEEDDSTNAPGFSGTGGRTGWDLLEHDGLACLPPELRPWVEQLIEELKPKGVFLVSKGSFRNWMPAEIQQAASDEWLVRTLNELHARRCSPELRAFVGDMVHYIEARLSAESRRPIAPRVPGPIARPSS